MKNYSFFFFFLCFGIDLSVVGGTNIRKISRFEETFYLKITGIIFYKSLIIFFF